MYYGSNISCSCDKIVTSQDHQYLLLCLVGMAEAGTSSTDWQTGLNCLSHRANHILNSSQWSDCSFLVGNENNQKVR